MNINDAKDYIRQTVKMYLTKNEFGEYEIPVVRQRPIFLIGAPGVGKTMIMEQIASEMGIALVSYSMTHHTRQSALGLPFIKHVTYNGEETDITEYTMSEIISSIYDITENSGIKEGILFLDEINCVSQTLMPSMLQFLQYKVFGRHSVPNGWVIVTAGNPVEYNKSVVEFDVAVLDRLKVIRVEADYKTFRNYALDNGVHPVVINFLDIKNDYFYKIETVAGGKNYVTARGWEDLSTMIKMYEKEGIATEYNLIRQYLNNEKIAREFLAYYDLYNKYKRDYHVEEILKGDYTDEIIAMAKRAPFDERLSLMGMLNDKVTVSMREVILKTDYLSKMSPVIKKLVENRDNLNDKLYEVCSKNRMQLASLRRANSVNKDNENVLLRSIKFLENASREVLSAYSGPERLKDIFNEEVKEVKMLESQTSKMLHNLFVFVDKAFSNGNEMITFMTYLTTNTYSSKYIARFKSDDYMKYQSELMIDERIGNLKEEAQRLINEYDI